VPKKLKLNKYRSLFRARSILGAVEVESLSVRLQLQTMGNRGSDIANLKLLEQPLSFSFQGIGRCPFLEIRFILKAEEHMKREHHFGCSK
jgi:hypothetical protein